MCLNKPLKVTTNTMKILVCISHVPDTTSKINFTEDNAEFDTNGVQYIINPYDEFVLAKAMHLKEELGASITVINVGTAETESSLRKAMAIGADEAIRINASPKDGFFVAQQIAEIARTNTYDLIFAGRESIDYNGGTVPGVLATLLDYNFINACVGLEIENTTATAQREIDGGSETLQADFPLVIAGQKGLTEEKDLRIPNMRGIMMARKKTLAILEPIETGDKTGSKGFEKPQENAACKMVGADDIDGLIDLLHNEAKVI
jgi:electron transfer flavoprotein beta subunit